MRLFFSVVLLAAASAVPAALPAQDTPADSIKVKKPTRLFREETPFTITLVSDFKRFKDRDTTTQEWVPSTLHWKAEGDSGDGLGGGWMASQRRQDRRFVRRRASL